MKFEEPLDIGFTIYTKSGCSFCKNLKKLLIEKCIFFFEIYCNSYLIENKEDFLSFIKEKANKEYKYFPIVFLNSSFIGGYNETKEYLDNLDKDYNNIFDLI